MASAATAIRFCIWRCLTAFSLLAGAVAVVVVVVVVVAPGGLGFGAASTPLVTWFFFGGAVPLATEEGVVVVVTVATGVRWWRGACPSATGALKHAPIFDVWCM